MGAKLSAKDAAAKLRRARVHLNELDRRLWAFQKRHPYSVVRNYKPGLEYIQLEFSPAAEPPLSFGTVLGDFIQNLRGSLNCLVYEMTLLDPAVTDDILDSVEFPIFPEARPAAIEKRIRNIPQEAKDIIEAMQPYHRGDRAEAEPLWILHQMATLDRHTLIPFAGHQIRTGATGQPPRWATISGALHKSKMMIRVRLADEEDFMEHLAGRVVFSTSTPLIPWIGIDGLREMHHMVGEEILPKFNRFFPKARKS